MNRQTILWSGIIAAAMLFDSPHLMAQAEQNENLKVSAAARWDAYVGQFLDSQFAAQPDSAVWEGRHEFDGKLPDWSAAGLKRESQRLKSQREQALAFAEDQLDARRRFERDYLLAQLDKARYWLEVSEEPYTNPKFYGDALDPDVYVSREYAPLETRIKSFTQYASNVPQALQQAKGNLRLPMARTRIKIGRRMIGGLAEFYARDVAAVFAPVKDEQLQRQFRLANEAAIRAVREFDEWLSAEEPAATDDFRLGPARFTQMLKMTEGVEIQPDEIEAIGRRDLERNQRALKQACEQFAPGKSVRECMVLATAHKPKNPDPVLAATDQLGMLRKFVLDNDIMTIPGKEVAEVRKAPAYQAWNFAYINIPGAYEKGLPSI